MNTEFTLFDTTFTLKRYPYQPGSDLQAWSAGDEYLLQHLRVEQLDSNKRILVLNDHFGALSCALAQHNHVTFVSDSHIAHLALKQNLQLNDLQSVTMLTSLDPLPSDVDLVIFPLPKINRMLTWQLTQLRQLLDADVPIIAVDKAKQIHSSTLKLFEQYLGTTTTSLAKKKHRLIFAKADAQSPRRYERELSWSAQPQPLTLTNLPNVYGGEKLDLGARLLLEHLPSTKPEQQVIDLGCGNGVIGVRYKQLYPQAKVTFVDESYMALASAELNLKANADSNAIVDCQFVADNCLESFEPSTADLVLCNPPFHQQNAVTDHIAKQMFRDARTILKTKGRLRVIGNRHLGYYATLSKLFGRERVSLVTQNSKFVVIDAIKG